MTTPQDTFFAVSDEIADRFPVADWRVGGIPVWPVLRISLPHAVAARDQSGTQTGLVARNRLAPRAWKIARFAATPAVNIWRGRGHSGARFQRADALFLGTGATYDWLDGALQDRFCEPLIAQYEKRGNSSLLMEDGEVCGPQLRPVYPANTLDRWARLVVRASGSGSRLDAQLEGLSDMLAFLRREGFPTHYFEERMARYHAALIGALATRFEGILARVEPRMAFMVRYYNELGYALCLACRRKGILSIELQHGGQGGQHEAYNGFKGLSADGYSILPAVFWNWTPEDAAAISSWADRLARPWHRSIHGGHPQLSPWLDGSNHTTRAFDARIVAMGHVEKNILVALQDLPEFAPVWDALAKIIAGSPKSWRWWLRRHPSPLYQGNGATDRILALCQSNVVIGEASTFPLPALLRQMDVVLCHTSGTTMEASAFGVPSIFLSENARGLFSDLLRAGRAEIITDMERLKRRLSDMPRRVPQCATSQPAIAETLARLDEIAADYRALCPG